MAGTSKFVQIHPQILLEYTYTDMANPETHETDNTVPDDFPIELLTDGYTETNFLFNADSTEALSGNTRNRSAVPVNSLRTRFAFLNIDIPLPYNDFDDELTDAGDLLQVFSPDLEVKYDTVRYHFISGFNFSDGGDDLDGFIFEIKTRRRDAKFDNLSSLVFRKADNFQTLNPNPFLVGNKLYTSYIEVKIPALFYLNEEFAGAPLNSNLVGYRYTDSIGFISTTGIEVALQGIHTSEKINGHTFFDVRELSAVTLGQKDDFDLLIARVQDSPSGDYFEFFGEYNGDIFEDFMTDLNNQPDSDYIAFHEIVVSEQLSTGFTETARQTLIQTEGFDDVMRYRPIIINSAIATSFTLEYILRLINRVDSSQIIKRSQLVSFEVSKYGRSITRLNLGTVPTVVNVFNSLSEGTEGLTLVNPVPPGIEQGPTKIKTPITTQTEFVNVFRDRHNIKVSVTPVSIQSLTQGSGNQSIEP